MNQTTLLTVAGLLFATGCSSAIDSTDPTSPSDDLADPAPFFLNGGGNGAPSGPHYNLNIIGVPNTKTMSNGSGNVIFVPETGSAKIMLSEGANFDVIDKNGTDGSAAFQLPNPDPDNDGTTAYSVFARALGKPGGSSKTTTCATDVDGVLWCSVYSMVLVREGGKSTFTNVSRELLYIYADTNADGKLERYNLFNSALTDYFWQYDNAGLKLAQLRFYQIPTTVPDP
jgi:hypothetical protein